MEIAQVRKRVQTAIAAARAGAQERRQRVATAERAYATFLQDIATPIARQVATALKAEGYAFTVSTPGDALQLSTDRSRGDFIEIALDANAEHPHVIGRITQTRGSRRLDEERPIKPGAAPEALTEADVLEFILDALQPWLAR